MGLRWGAPAGSSRGPAWAVVLELAVPDGRGTLDFATVEALVEYLADWEPSALYDPHRYAIQVQLSAPDAESALVAAIQGHDKAALALGLSFLSLVRAEVLTTEELASGQAGSGMGEMFAGSGSPAGPGDSKPSDALYQATRALLAVTSAEELRGVMANFVVEVGGRLAAGDVELDASTMPLDLSLGQGGPLFAVAQPLSAARRRLEESLPRLVEDAQRVRTILTRSGPGGPARSSV